jgi:diguanylate cyclase (GGDEF)-like protein/PAS domain S-box-containing protein
MSTSKRRKPSLLDRVIAIGQPHDASQPAPALAPQLPRTLRIAAIGRSTPALPDLEALLASEGFSLLRGATLADARRFLVEEQLDLLYVLEPLPGATLADAGRALRAMAGDAPPYLVALTTTNPAPRRALALAGYDDILGPRFSADRLAQGLIAAARRVPHAAPPPEEQSQEMEHLEAREPSDAAALYRQVLDALPDGVFLHDLAGRLVMGNTAVATLTGHAVDALPGLPFAALCRAEDAALLGEQFEVVQHMSRATAPGQGSLGPVPFQLMRADGRVVAAELSLRVLPHPPFGSEPLVLAMLRAHGEHDRTAQELQAMQEIVQVVSTHHDLAAALQEVLDILAKLHGYRRATIWTTGHDETLVRQAFLGTSANPEMSWDDSSTGRAARTRQPVYQRDVPPDHNATARDTDVTSSISVPVLRDDDLVGVITVEGDEARPLEERDLAFLESLATQLAGLIERIELYQTLAQQATTDPTTGLPNREVFARRLDEAISATQGAPVSILMLGVDKFKTTNELYGHAVADTVLRQVGQVLQARLAAAFFLARYTSDQFVVLLPGVDRDRTVSIAEDLRIAVATHLFSAAEQVEQLTVSIGAATCPDDAEHPAALIRAADHAMYLAKRAGCNQTFQSNAAFATLAAAHGRINDLLRQSPGRTLSLLISAMDQRLRERAGHSERVTRYAAAIASALGLLPDEIAQLRLAAYIHDIGMMSLPDALLRKPTTLTPDERKLLRTVPVSARGLLSQLDLPESVFLAVVHLRENWDGTGYPSGLRGEDIPLGARVIAVADALDAMTSDRAHRDALSLGDALDQIQALAGTQFDPRVARAALRLLDLAPTLHAELPGTPNPLLDADGSLETPVETPHDTGSVDTTLRPFSYP